jgi:putative transposase
MSNVYSLSHTAWDCKYHLVWIPKYRKKEIFGSIRGYLGEALRELALHKESKIIEGHLMKDHVHMLVSIPPNMLFPRLLDISREKARCTLHVTTQDASAILLVKISGPEGILYQQLEGTKKR